MQYRMRLLLCYSMGWVLYSIILQTRNKDSIGFDELNESIINKTDQKLSFTAVRQINIPFANQYTIFICRITGFFIKSFDFV